MVTLAFAVVAYIRAFFVSRHKLALETVAIRQQLAVFKRKQTRPKLRPLHRLFWIALGETVVSWHRGAWAAIPTIPLYWRDGKRNLAEVEKLTRLELGDTDVDFVSYFRFSQRHGYVDLIQSGRL